MIHQIEPAAEVDRVEGTPPIGVKYHHYANIFPMMDAAAHRELVEDVRLNGVLEPIVFIGDAILDGRNRYMAARRRGVSPRELAMSIVETVAREGIVDAVLDDEVAA